MQTTISSTLQGTPQTGTNAGALKTDIQNGFEWAGSLIILLTLRFNVVIFTIKFLFAFEFIIQAKILESAASNQQAGGIGCRIILVAAWDAKLGEFCGIASSHTFVTQNGRVHNLANEFGVGESDHQPVLASTKFAFVLASHSATSLVISLTLTTATPLYLIPFEEGSILQDFDKSHYCCSRANVDLGFPCVFP